MQNLSLRDNVALPLRFGSDMSDREIEGRLQVALAAARLTRSADLRPAQANEEQRRRAAFARALAFDPELVILDHPFDGLTNRASAELLELARGGETGEGSRRTVFVTGQDLPDNLRPRIELRYRLTRGLIEREP
jgi:ABC-type transporter Mla maintaining outer membrane lipid asymmetry ATPase subunit MlaF